MVFTPPLDSVDDISHIFTFISWLLASSLLRADTNQVCCFGPSWTIPSTAERVLLNTYLQHPWLTVAAEGEEEVVEVTMAAVEEEVVADMMVVVEEEEAVVGMMVAIEEEAFAVVVVIEGASEEAVVDLNHQESLGAYRFDDIQVPCLMQ